MLLDGKKVRDDILLEAKEKIAKEGLKLTLAIIFAGNDGPSEVYVNNKIKYCNQVGISPKLIKMPEAVGEDDIVSVIKDLNADDSITGIILQSPLPRGLDMEGCIKHIDPKKDIDGFTKESFYSLYHNLDGLRPCTVKGIVRLLEHYNIPIEGQKICIVGKGNIVGKPLTLELLNQGATVFTTHKLTKDLKEVTLISDIIIAAAGHAGLITKDMVKEGAVVIDVGITVEEGKIKGDACFEDLKDKCSYITPNPGGVGPMTIAMIIENVLDAGKRR